MEHLTLVLLALSGIAIILIAIKNSRHTKRQEEINRRFLEKEEAANAVRKKEIEPNLFYTPVLSGLPQIPIKDPFQIERCAKRTMIHFPEPISNLEIKKQYGIAQMDIIAQYEENFSEYLKALTKWAVSIAEENPEDALSILETVVSLGGEFRDTYRVAADICAAKGNIDNLCFLQAQAESNHFKDPSIRSQVLEYIDKKKEELLP